jgi:tripartite ATP-independent transporter DctM subunit
MEWQWTLILIFAVLVILMLTAMPVAYSFFLISLVGVYIYWGGTTGLAQLGTSIYASLAQFTLVPLVLFILMGDILFNSNVAPLMMGAVDKLLGKVPGRLSFLTVVTGTIFAVMTGSGMSSVAMLGSTLCPEMAKRGYKKAMILGPILGSGGLAILIPPTNLGIIFGALARVSIGAVLIAIVLPGVMLACIYAVYILIRASLQPDLAPTYKLPATPLSDKLMAFAKYILPLAVIIFLVLGVIFLGIATPTEAAATGVLGAVILALAHRGFTWQAIKKSLDSTIHIAVMAFLIIAGADAYSRIIVFTGASAQMSAWVISLNMAPLAVIAIMMLAVLILGMFMNPVAIMMITVPIFMPIVAQLNYDPIWFSVLFMINCEISGISPPFGMSLFVLKGVAPKDTTLGDIFRAGAVWSGFGILAIIIIMFVPSIALWLPGLMKMG